MRIEFLVEEPSMKAALDGLLPALIGPPPAFEVYNYGSKQQLLAKLPDRLRGYAGRLRSGEDLRVVVLVDRDEQDCLDLKRALEATAATAGLRTRTAARQHGFAGFEALTRVVCEELESWYFGDPAAVRAAYARVKPAHFDAKHLRAPDAIRGGTWEALLRTLQKAGYYPPPLPNNAWKYDAAQRLGPRLSLTPTGAPSANASASFQQLLTGVRALLVPPAA